MRPEEIIQQLRELRVPQQLVADTVGIGRVQATKMLNGRRQMKGVEVEPLVKLLDQWKSRPQPNFGGYLSAEPAEDTITYVPVDILPAFAGMGGGGVGLTMEGEAIEKALVPRYLIEDVFRGRPADFVVVRTRGDSMEPDFRQDDELLCDKRDVSPAQPGPFAVYDGDDDAYVIKNIEKSAAGGFRIFSTNPKYLPREVTREETRIIGRPVWFGRRL
jgi:hypothetical protein